jgi:hypothetical protein
MVAAHVPLIMLGRYVAFSSSVAWCMTASIAPRVSTGASVHAMFAVVSSSPIARPIVCGKPPPPNSSGNCRVGQPPST